MTQLIKDGDLFSIETDAVSESQFLEEVAEQIDEKIEGLRGSH